MTPQQYIEALKSDNDPQVIHDEDLPEWITTLWKEQGGTRDALVRSVNDDFAQYLLERLKPRLSNQLLETFDSGFIAVAAINNAAPNAYVKSLSDKGYAIIFHTGLKDFIYRIARILATRFQPSGKNDETEDMTPFEESARLIAEVFWWLQETGRSFGPHYSIDEQQIKIANMLALEAETFLLAHEIGHVIDDSADRQGEGFMKLSEALPVHYRDEHVADLLALYLMMELHNENAERHQFKTPLTYAGVEFALQIFRGLERLGFPFDTSHPPAEERLSFIRSEMRTRCLAEQDWSALTALAFGIESIFSNIIALIESPGEHQHFFERAAEQIVMELNELLDQNTGGMVPDYASFYPAANDLLARGYSHKLLERTAEVAADFFADAGESKEVKSDYESWKRFQKFKLLLGFFESYTNEPARSLFLEALHMNG